jgi:uncharacterized membrane protein YfcA
LSLLTALLAVLCGGIVGFSLGLVGGGGSILAVPMILYIVGVRDAHIAIGTSALAVSLNAFIGFAQHWRVGNVHWPCALVFAIAGVIGAAIGSTLGKMVDGQSLVLMFAFLMIAVGVAMLLPRKGGVRVPARLNRVMATRLSAVGYATGFLSGFFGIGGGFLVVPGIILASGMPIINAIGTSLFAVGAFGMTTAINYAISGFVDVVLAAEFIAGGAMGGFLGTKAANALAQKKQALTYVFVAVILTVALYMIWREWGGVSRPTS